MTGACPPRPQAQLSEQPGLGHHASVLLCRLTLPVPRLGGSWSPAEVETEVEPDPVDGPQVRTSGSGTWPQVGASGSGTWATGGGERLAFAGAAVGAGWASGTGRGGVSSTGCGWRPLLLSVLFLDQDGLSSSSPSARSPSVLLPGESGITLALFLLLHGLRDHGAWGPGRVGRASCPPCPGPSRPRKRGLPRPSAARAPAPAAPGTSFLRRVCGGICCGSVNLRVIKRHLRNLSKS